MASESTEERDDEKGRTNGCGARHADRLIAGIAAAGFALFAVHLLYSALCAFSWKNFLMMDYGAYTNFLYNLAHGDGFRFLFEHNYLKTHLSYSFVLLAPLVHLWDSPLLLIMVQWLFLMGGSVFLWRVLRRGRVASPLAASILFCFVAYPATQGVMLSEFHGVSAYYLLLPWILHAATFHKRWTILPVLILLGLREDAGLVVLPMLVYLSVRDRWRTGYALAALTIAYVAFAIFVLYPWINGEALVGVRASEASSASILNSLAFPRLVARLQGVFWLFLPAGFVCIAFRRAWVPLLCFPSFALIQALGSAMERQHSLGFHYPAAAFSAILCAMAFAAVALPAVSRWKWGAAGLQRFAAVGVVAATLGAHFERGFFLEGGASQRVYARFHPQFLPLIDLAEELPKEGLLLCNQNVAPYFSLRSEIMVLHYYDSARHRPEFILTDVHEIQTARFAPIVAAIEAGEFGLYDMRFPYIVLRHGHSVGGNEGLLRNIRAHVMVPALMASQGGEVGYDAREGLVKEWAGGDSIEPVPIAFGGGVHLVPGDYVVRVRLQAPPVDPAPATGYGVLSVHRHGEAEALAQSAIVAGTDDSFGEQLLPFSLAEPARVEPRVAGGRAEIRVRSIRIEPWR